MSFPASVSPLIEGLIRDAQAGEETRAVLDWLAQPAGSSADDEAAALAHHLDLLGRAPIAHAARVRVLDIFHGRAQSCSRALKPALAAGALPIEPGLRKAADTLRAVHMHLAHAYLDALRARAAHRPARSAGRAMVCVLEAYALGVLIGADDPPGMWGSANALLIHARTVAAPAVGSPAAVDAEQLYRQLVALALAQPPNLAPADFFNVAEYVASYSGAVQIQGHPPHRDLDSWYWLDTELDQGPIALLRIPADDERDAYTLFCSCQRLGQLLGQHLDLVEEGGDANDLHLPACLDRSSTRRLMRSLQSRWMAMPRRQFSRRERVQPVRMLIGFDAIWHLLEHRDQPIDWDSRTTRWTMLNDSPNGFALKLEDGQTGLVRPGAPVLIKGAGARNWMICVVRWARSSRADEVEVGIELLSHGAQAATVVFQADDPALRKPVAALRLPAITGQRPQPRLMLPAAAAKGRDILIAHIAGTHCRLGDARLSGLDLQTHSFELFELEELPASAAQPPVD